MTAENEITIFIFYAWRSIHHIWSMKQALSVANCGSSRQSEMPWGLTDPLKSRSLSATPAAATWHATGCHTGHCCCYRCHCFGTTQLQACNVNNAVTPCKFQLDNISTSTTPSYKPSLFLILSPQQLQLCNKQPQLCKHANHSTQQLDANPPSHVRKFHRTGLPKTCQFNVHTPNSTWQNRSTTNENDLVKWTQSTKHPPTIHCDLKPTQDLDPSTTLTPNCHFDDWPLKCTFHPSFNICAWYMLFKSSPHYSFLSLQNT